MRLFILILTLLFSLQIFAQEKTIKGTASFYHQKFHGRKTATGETFDSNGMTAACNQLPLGTLVKVTNLKNGKSVIVKINDRLHAKNKRLIDLSYLAAKELNFIQNGTCKVEIEVISTKKNQSNIQEEGH